MMPKNLHSSSCGIYMNIYDTNMLYFGLIFKAKFCRQLMFYHWKCDGFHCFKHWKLMWYTVYQRVWISAKVSSSSEMDGLNLSGIDQKKEPVSLVKNYRYEILENTYLVIGNKSYTLFHLLWSETFRSKGFFFICRIFVATWNVAGKCPDYGLDLEDLLKVEIPADIYVLGYDTFLYDTTCTTVILHLVWLLDGD